MAAGLGNATVRRFLGTNVEPTYIVECGDNDTSSIYLHHWLAESWKLKSRSVAIMLFIEQLRMLTYPGTLCCSSKLTITLIMCTYIVLMHKYTAQYTLRYCYMPINSFWYLTNLQFSAFSGQSKFYPLVRQEWFGYSASLTPLEMHINTYIVWNACAGIHLVCWVSPKSAGHVFNCNIFLFAGHYMVKLVSPAEEYWEWVTSISCYRGNMLKL